MLSVKLASQAISGRLNGHPLIQGLSLQCYRMMEKADRGIFTLAGRRGAETELEKSLIHDAGIQLAVAAGNKALAMQFGLSGRSGHIDLDVLKQASLPVAPIALLWPEELANNFKMADQRYVWPHLAPKRG